MGISWSTEIGPLKKFGMKFFGKRVSEKSFLRNQVFSVSNIFQLK